MFAQLFRTLAIFTVAFQILFDYLWLDFMERFRSDRAQAMAEERAYRRWGGLLRKRALRLHGLIIKVGQFLSTRADILPDSFTRELSSLQDAVPAAPYAAIRRRVESELGAPLESIFAEFETEALASASFGQVHRARLPEGQTVAVKVLRPGVERLVATDMAALWRIAKLLTRFTRWGSRFDLPAIMDEFEMITYQEMDYRQEADNLRRFRKNFGGEPGIDLPCPFDHLVTERLLVMDFKVGMKLTERDRLLAAGLDPQKLAERLVEAYLKQILVDGFVHVDPHPGNLMVREDGTLILIDFGMMGRITPTDRVQFAALVSALITRDLEGAVQALRDLGFLREGANTEVLKRALELLVNQLSGVKLQPGAEFDQFLADFRAWLYEEPLQFPARYLFIGRAAGLLAGLAMGLDPNIDWLQVLKERALPLLESNRQRESDDKHDGFDWRQILTELFGPGAAAAADLAWKQVAATGVSLVHLPGQVERTLGRLESGDLRVKPDLTELTGRLDRQAKLVNRLVWALLVAGSGVTGAVLQVGGLAYEAEIAWAAGGVALLFLFGNLLFGGRRSRHFSPHRRLSKR